MNEDPTENAERINPLWVSIFLSIAIPALFIWFSVYFATGIYSNYGLALFIITPILSGFICSLLLTLQQESSLKRAIWAGLVSIAIAFALIMLWAIEGLICLIMASPIFLILNIAGSVLGHTIGQALYARRKVPVLFAVLILNPAFIAIEGQSEIKPEKMITKTSVIVNAPPAIVWQSVVRKNNFTGFDNYFFFRSGVAYPKSTVLVSHQNKNYFVCDYSQGEIAIPVQSLIENRELKFAFEDTPAPMKELSFYPDLELPHLHGYFHVLSGQIQLNPLPGNQTELLATTTYTYKIKPIAYWKNWTNYLLNEVHFQVLSTIKTNSESQNGNRTALQ